MRKEKMLKLVLVLLTSIIIMAMSVNVFAADDNVLNDFLGGENFDNMNDEYENQDQNQNTPSLNTNTPVEENKTPATNNTNNTNTNLPEAGLAEDTMAGVAVTILAITAIYAYRKVKEYKNI